MKTNLRTRFSALFTAVLLTASLSATAGDEAVRPSQFDLKAFVRASLNFIGGNAYAADALVEKLQSKPTDRVCVCEIMELQNNNASFSNVALLAEKTNNGDMGRDYKIAERQLTKEKKQMKAQFFDKVQVNTKIAVATDCISLYIKLRQESLGLKLYDILDADVRATVK